MLQLQLLESKPNRRETRARRADEQSRADPINGAHSGDGLSNRTQESE